ncbi:MAG: hypothetical protein ACXVFQ_24465 [Solirubrobacteraceae bacterium]
MSTPTIATHDNRDVRRSTPTSTDAMAPGCNNSFRLDPGETSRQAG